MLFNLLQLLILMGWFKYFFNCWSPEIYAQHSQILLSLFTQNDAIMKKHQVSRSSADRNALLIRLSQWKMDRFVGADSKAVVTQLTLCTFVVNRNASQNSTHIDPHGGWTAIAEDHIETKSWDCIGHRLTKTRQVKTEKKSLKGMSSGWIFWEQM